MTDRRLVFHFGDMKTGTTSIQEAFHTLRWDLQAAGVLYPTTPWPRPSHVLLVPAVFGAAALSPTRRARIGASEGEILNASCTSIEDIVRQIEAAAPDTVVLSCEIFFRELDRQSGRRLGELADRLGAEATFACYVREPVSAFVSAAQQQLKSGSHIRHPQQGRLRRVLSSYLDAFPGRVGVRAFPQLGDASPDIVADFMANFVPAALPQVRDRPSVRVNTSMSAEAMVLAQRIAAYIEAAGHGRQVAEIRSEVVALRLADAAVSGFSRPRVRPEFARSLICSTAELDWLREMFGVEFPSIHGARIDNNHGLEFRSPLRVEDFCLVDAARLRRLEVAFGDMIATLPPDAR